MHFIVITLDVAHVDKLDGCFEKDLTNLIHRKEIGLLKQRHLPNFVFKSRGPLIEIAIKQIFFHLISHLS